MNALALALLCTPASGALPSQDDSYRNVFAGRILGVPEGAEPRASFHMWGGRFGEVVRNPRLELGDDGAFRFTYQEWSRYGDFHGQVVLWTAATESSPLLAATTLWSGMLDGGVHDLGELTLTIPPVLVSGTITSGGTPLAGTRIGVYRELAQRVPPAERGHWKWQGFLDCVADAEGRFEVRGLVGTGTRKLRLEMRRWPPVEVQVGCRDLLLEEPVPGTVSGRFLLAEGVPRSGIRAELEPLTPGAKRVSVNLIRDRFLLAPLPGRYRLWATVRGDEPVVLNPSILVSPGEVLELPDIDLRARIHCVTVMITNLLGEPVPRVRLQRRPAGAPEPFDHAVLRGPALEFAASSSAFDFRAVADGFRTAELDAIGDAEITIRLREPYRVVVRLPDAIVELAAGARVELNLELRPETGPVVSGVLARPWDVLTLQLPEAGTYTGGLVLRDPLDPLHAVGSIEEIAKLTVLDLDGPQNLVVEVSDEVLEWLEKSW